DRIVATARAELERRLRVYRGDRPLPDLRGKTAIVVDDGIATGVTFRAALRAIRALAPARIVLAVGVAPADALASLRAKVDDAECLATPADFTAVGVHFKTFPQVSDEEVIALLDDARRD
ncbi:MAG: phosphoribosyltransferase, partial [Chloroflexi bacterium]|nr:phosphoribosyltransferase [Chloroflexota bacterium]